MATNDTALTTVTIDTALRVAQLEPEATFTCPECHRPVRPYQGSRDGLRAAYFRHTTRNTTCSRSGINDPK